MSESLDKIIRQAEIQQLQIQMNVLLQRNMQVLKVYNSELHKKLQNYQPKRYILQLDPNNKLNIADKKDRVYIYNEVPEKFCKDQVDGYLNAQRLSRFVVSKNDIHNERHIHIPQLNQLIDELKELDAPVKAKADTFLSNIVISGVGLGFHIPQLMKAYDIQNIFIYESSLDTFFASLHTIDWSAIIAHFTKERRSLTLSVDELPFEAMERMEYNINYVGLHNYLFTFLFKHTNRPCESDFLKSFASEFKTFIGGLGYFDDEQIGLAHGYHNIQNNIPVLLNRGQYLRKTRLLIIGNGPSLDEHKQYIEKNQNDMIIMSCGTALGSLLRMGIKPDFHVEMERTNKTAQALSIGIKEQDKKEITLLCLHTVSPDVINAFAEAYCAIKPRDAGMTLIQSYFKGKKPAPLYFCNPTVTNCGLAFAISMGFTDIHLVGVDLAFAEGEHHSKNSLHYNMGEKFDSNHGQRLSYSDKKHYEIPGNFQETVLTHPLLDNSRISMERLLRLADKSLGNITCYNSNNGAKIDKTTTIAINDMPPPKSTNKVSEIANIKNHSFLRPNKDLLETNDPHSMLNHLFSIETKLTMRPGIKCDKELLCEMQRIIKLIAKENSLVTNQLLKGSVNLFFGAIVENGLYRKNNEDFIKTVEIGTKAFNKFISDVFRIMKTDPFRLDDTESPLFAKLLEQEVE